MLLFLVWWTDITEYYHVWSYRKNETLNNRTKTLSFRISEQWISEQSTIQVFEYTKTTQQTTSWNDTITVADLHTKTNKFREWQKIFVNIWQSSQRCYEIDTINTTNRTIKFTQNLTETIEVDSKIWHLDYSWIVIEAKQLQYKWWKLEYDVSCVDTKNALDRKNVAQTYEDQYTREIMWRIIYEFVAVNSSQDIDTFSSLWTEWWTGNAPTAETDDVITGNQSMKVTCTTGTAYREKTLWSTIDASDMQHLRFWRKVAEWEWTNMSSMTIRVWNDSSNYYAYNISKIWESYEDCRNYESIVLNEPSSVVWSPDLSVVDYFRIEVVASGTIWWSWDYMLFDHFFFSEWGFTINETIRWDRQFDKVSVTYRTPSEVFEELSKKQNQFRHIDYSNNIHYYENTWSESCPISITSSSENYWDLLITPDATNIVNRQTVIWWEAPETTLYTQEEEADWVQTSFDLDYKYSELKVYVDAWAWYVEKTVWTENLTDETTVDFIANFQEKVVRNASHATLSATDKIKMEYYPYKSIAYRYEDSTAIASMKSLVGWDGVFDWKVIIDKNIITTEDAFLRARSEVEAYKNPIITCTFTTNEDWIKVWQLISVVHAERGIDDSFLVQQIQKAQKGKSSYFEYKVTASSTLFGITELMQLLLKKTERLFINEDAIVYIVKNASETIVIEDSVELTQKDDEFRTASVSKRRRQFAWVIGSVTNNDWYLWNSQHWRQAVFSWSETWTAEFDSTTWHNSWNSLKITADTWWASKEIKVQWTRHYSMNWNTTHTFSWYINVWTLTNTTWNTKVSIELQEYDSSKNLLQTQIIGDLDSENYWTKYNIDFTSHTNTNSYKLAFVVKECAWVVEFADVVVEDTWTTETVTNPAFTDFSQT